MLQNNTSSSNTQPGILYIVATPIGNLKDITYRAIDILSNVHCILAEDTRHSKKLLNHYQILTPMQAVHDHNERQITQHIIHKLQQGQSLALISDAGTPMISDPGYFLVRACIEAGLEIVVIPGPCAAITALAGSGLPANQFSFVGFLPAKGKVRETAVEQLAAQTQTSILYESGRRLENLLSLCIEHLGEKREVVLAHELTKTYESYYRGSAVELLEKIQNQTISTKGEWVVCVAGQPDIQYEQLPENVKSLISMLVKHYPLSECVKRVMAVTNYKKNDIYQYALDIKNAKNKK